MDATTADYVLFLEKDFQVDPAAPPAFLREELLNAVTYLERGAMLFRLRSRRDLGKSGVKDCCSCVPAQRVCLCVHVSCARLHMHV